MGRKVWSREEAQAAARKSVIARRRRTPKNAALHRLSRNIDKLMKELIHAALADTDEWKDLEPKERLAALKLTMEYGFGKPRALAAPAEEAEEQKPEEEGLIIE